MAGIFLTIEGTEGSGKTTLIKQLVPLLEDYFKRECVVTREPGGNVIAEKIRDIILDRQHTDMDGRTEALLYAASRRQHLVATVIPALDAGKCIVCDRFVDSSLVYQGVARGIGKEGILAINHFATDGIQPDLTIYLDLDVSIGLSRIHKNRSDEVNRLDLESLSFHESVRQGYLELAKEYPERIKVISADSSPEIVCENVIKVIKEQFPKGRI